MQISRRTSVRIMGGAAGAAATGVFPAGLAQAPALPAQTSADPGLIAARNELMENAQRIARVKLPRATEPAFRFRP